jgi:RsiW-degrading membrane proteinase PrsW (M82 family)
LADPITLLLLSVAPACFLIKYILIKDRYKHEPMRLIFVTFALGAVLFAVAFLIEILFDNGTILALFLVVAGSEELVKFAAVRIKAYRSPHFYEVMDGVVFGVAAALGFATVENIIYVFGSGVSTAILRAFLSVPSHAAWGGIMGYYLGVAKTSGEKSKMRFILTGLGIAILFHGIYDSLLTVLGTLSALAAGLLMTIIAWVLLLRLIKKAMAVSPARWGGAVERGLAAAPIHPGVQASAGRCSKCGASLESGTRFCVTCGHPVS